MSGTRFTFRHQRKYDYQFDSQQSAESAENINRGDFKAQLSLPKDSTINGFYNNTDFSQVLYGVRYKGIKGELVQEINWDDFCSKKETLKCDLEYQVPQGMLKKLSFKSMRIYAVWRKSWEDINRSQDSTSSFATKRIYDDP